MAITQHIKTCPSCKRQFTTRHRVVICCSKKCAQLMRPRVPVSERFFSFVSVGSADACWPWTGRKFENGYGQFKLGSKCRKASRVSWELHNGPIPEGKYVLHRCDNPPCVNPTHLFLGTHKENMSDMVAKGRHKNWRAVLASHS